MSIPAFDEARFRQQVQKALLQIKTILDNTRNPQYPEDVPHAYDDKYQLVEFATNTAMAAQLNCFVSFGLNQQQLEKLLSWAKTQSVTLRFKSEERCAFDRKQDRKVEAPKKHVTQVAGVSITDKVVTTVTDYFWKFEVEYELFAFPGTKPEDKIVLTTRGGKTEILTSTDVTPKPKVSVIPSMDINITWLLKLIGADMGMNFSIDRSDKKCRTPRQNTPVNNALTYFREFYAWSDKVRSYFMNAVFPSQKHSLDVSKINDQGVFVPVVPLLEANSQKNLQYLPSNSDASQALTTSTVTTSGLVFVKDISSFLDEQKRSLGEKFSNISTMFKDTQQLLTLSEAKIVVTCIHAQNISVHYSDTVEYIEHLLRKQLIAAIGKEVGPQDFNDYMRFHERNLFLEEFQPQPFSYAVRRPFHDPEGIISIEEIPQDGSVTRPIQTTVRFSEASTPMKFAINSSTLASFYGDRHVHSWITHRFSNQEPPRLKLVSRARQFSSYILLVGRIAGPTLFQPIYASILKNKDELEIPLNLQQIPAAKEFRDAIESLSPEQQRFAKAYRGMQLSSTLFGIGVLQIKPQLEKLLNLEDDSLTKELKLTQDLLEIFITYQLPSDLVSFNGDKKASKEERLRIVKNHVEAIKSMIKEAKEKEIAEQKEKARLEALKVQENASIQYLRDVSAIEFDMDLNGWEEECLGKEEEECSMLPSKDAASLELDNLLEVCNEIELKEEKPQTPRQQQPRRQQQQKISDLVELPEPDGTPVKRIVYEELDYTKLPAAIDQKFLELDEDGAVRPTIINPGDEWTMRVQKSLLSKPTEKTMFIDDQETSRNTAFDLIDALTRSGALPFDHASLHVVLAGTHCFDKTLINTVVQSNVNPIEKVEKSLLIMTSTIMDKPPAELIQPEQLNRVMKFSPSLFTGVSTETSNYIEQ